MSYMDRLLTMALVGLLLFLSGCQQAWKFAPAEARQGNALLSPPTTLAGQNNFEGAERPTPDLHSNRQPTADSRVPPAARITGISSPTAGSTVFAVPSETPSLLPDGDSLLARLPQHQYRAARFPARMHHNLLAFRSGVYSDHRNYYSWPTMRKLLYGVALASPLANTSLDEDFQSWYQRDVRGAGTDSFSSFWKAFGEGHLFIPAYASLALVGGMLDERPLFAYAGEFGSRVTRGYLVGAPPALFMQFALGGSRPGEDADDSHWKFFDDANAVSGHAFVGAVPLITAAKMVENPWLKGTLYACSTFPAWSRVNDDAHYLSQIWLGWWMAYLACEAVDNTECASRCYEFTPFATPEITGIGVVIRR